mgnify:FL=1
MKIIITGSSGFIGGHLKEKLKAEGNEVIAWDRKIGLDIQDFKLEPNTDFVIHLAANADVRRSIQFPDEYWKNNVEPTTKIQRQCYFNRVPLLYASSSCIHSWAKSPYGTSKKVNEETAFPGQVALRFTTVYGEGARESMFIGKLMRNEIQYATNHIRDFIHVSDVLNAIELIMLKMTDPHLFPETSLTDAYDIGTGIGNIVSSLARIRYPGVDIRAGDHCESPDNTADNSKLKELGWEPKVNVVDYLSQGIK